MCVVVQLSRSSEISQNPGVDACRELRPLKRRWALAIFLKGCSPTFFVHLLPHSIPHPNGVILISRTHAVGVQHVICWGIIAG